mgnify:CR=1 FL=1
MLAPCHQKISTHTPLAGRDNAAPSVDAAPVIFQLTRPLRGVTLPVNGTSCPLPFQLTRPLRGVTEVDLDEDEAPFISTHTPLAGRDCRLYPRKGQLDYISTHTPLAGRDADNFGFLRHNYISTHTPLAGRDKRKVDSAFAFSISTHTPLAGRDYIAGYCCRDVKFQLTRPLRGVTPTVQPLRRRYQGFQLTRPLRGVTCAIRRR